MDKQIIVPGEKVFDQPRQCEGCYVEDGKTYACAVGLSDGSHVVPLKGMYTPRRGDFVVGIVSEENFSALIIDLNSPYEGRLGTRDLREKFELGDVLGLEIIGVNEVHEPELARPRKLFGGQLIEIEPVKVPRVIGRGGSMLGIINTHTKTTVLVGKNGRVYLKGGDAALAALAIFKICDEAHLSGLTDRVTAFLQEENAKNGSQ